MYQSEFGHDQRVRIPQKKVIKLKDPQDRLSFSPVVDVRPDDLIEDLDRVRGDPLLVRPLESVSRIVRVDLHTQFLCESAELFREPTYFDGTNAEDRHIGTKDFIETKARTKVCIHDLFTRTTWVGRIPVCQEALPGSGCPEYSRRRSRFLLSK